MKSFIAVCLSLLVVLSSAAHASPSDVLVTGPDGVSVTVEDVLAEAEQKIPPEARAQALADPKTVLAIARELAVRRNLAAQATAAALDREPMIGRRLQLAQESILAEAWIDRAGGAALDRAALERAAAGEYRARSEKFMAPEQVRVRHILLDRRSCDVEKRIELLLVQARQPGADFAELARAHSQDEGSAKQGGDLGFIERGKLAPDFERAAFALKQPGQVSDVVRTSFGLHIIRLEERKPATQQPYESVRDAIVRDVERRTTLARRTQVAEPVSAALKPDFAAIEAFTAQQGADAARAAPPGGPK